MRTILLAGASVALLGSNAFAEAPARPTDVVQELVVVGSRAAPRLATETAAPVDVFSAEALLARGDDDVAKRLQFLSPSFNYTRAATLASAVGTRPVSLRGLAVDQVLVLVNGHRRHSAAPINTNNGFGRGTVPVDLNAIPSTAIQRIEILRDGASAQYGSDAIAGVVNIVLRDDASGGLASLQGGITEKGDGKSGALSIRHGFKLGEDGFLTATGEVRAHGFSNSAGVDTRFGRVTQRIGDPKTFDANLTLNAEAPSAWGALYGYATLVRRHTESSPIFRAPSTFPAFYPDGFLVLIKQKTFDLGATVGGRGKIGAWSWDVSDTVGYNRADFRPSNTVNTSLGTASPRSFDSGGARYGQNLVNLSLDRPLAVLAGGNLAFGLEHRYEGYKLRPGEPLSYAGSGAQGFPGFNPPSPIDVHRTAFSAYADGELSPVTGLDLGLAARFEHYSDFGDKVTGKASVFFRANDVLALRATASTGFRAPSLQQAHFATVTSQLVSGALVNVGNFAVDSPVSRALGATSLRPETSRNYSAGLVLTPAPNLTLTADAFQIDIDGRITFSEALAGADVTRILAANGIANASQVRFFTNAADTTTKGYELALHYVHDLASEGRVELNLGYSNVSNKVTSLRQNPVLPRLPLLGATSIQVMTTAQPVNKVVLSGSWIRGPVRLSADAVRFGHYRFSPLGPVQTFGAVWSLDLTANYEVSETLQVTAGVINATNQYPDEVVGQIDGRTQLEAGGLGYNGREYFVRVTRRF